MKTAGLILADQWAIFEKNGKKEKMPAALYPIEESTAIRKVIMTFRRAGITPIYVIAGDVQPILTRKLAHNSVTFLVAENLEDGLAKLVGVEKRIVTASVDRPFFTVSTLWELVDSHNGVRLFSGEKNTGLGLYTEYGNWSETALKESPDPGSGLSLLTEEGRQNIERVLRQQRILLPMQSKVKIVIGKETDFFGPGVCRLLQKIEETGSIQAAAEEMGMSYTKSWKMINRVEDNLGILFLDRKNGGKKGGSSSLTEEARDFIRCYLDMQDEVRKFSDACFQRYFQKYIK